MFKTIRNAWAIPDLRSKMIFTILMLIVYRLGSVIPVPGLSADAMAAFMSQDGGMGLFTLLDTFTGGAFSNATIFAMGITPYINSSIIMQLLAVAIPALERLQKEGEEGRKKINSITRYVTVVLALIQAIGLYFTLKAYGVVENPGFMSFVVIALTFTAGTAFIMWVGEQITEKGIGNGISLIIFAGIVSRLPQAAVTLYNEFLGVNLTVVSAVLLIVVLALSVAVVGFVVFMNEAERRIPVQYAKRVVGRKMYGGQSTNIPIKVAMAGVIPIIFASSIVSFPATIAQFAGGIPQTGFWHGFFELMSPGGWLYGVLYFVLIIFFTYFYTAMQFNPIEMANNIKRNGGFVPGIRPGKPTSDYIAKVLNRVVLVGALFLALIAVFPMAFSGVIPSMMLGGTSLLIVEGVALETVKQIESQMLMRHYKGFLD
ncbi:MAG: preprotein translocase subunit SecY [Ruminococcaceae bacterium]|nr:preprotein translocase subunit SecY [Oscillospiraceae bacterium]